MRRPRRQWTPLGWVCAVAAVALAGCSVLGYAVGHGWRLWGLLALGVCAAGGLWWRRPDYRPVQPLVCSDCGWRDTERVVHMCPGRGVGLR